MNKIVQYFYLFWTVVIVIMYIAKLITPDWVFIDLLVNITCQSFSNNINNKE